MLSVLSSVDSEDGGKVRQKDNKMVFGRTQRIEKGKKKENRKKVSE